MLLGFIGAPCSGKTTIASKMFSNFKEVGTNCELIVEQARQYISKLRYEQKLPADEKLILEDADQRNIALRQLEIERSMKYSCGINTIIISDSSVLNAGLYMSESMYGMKSIQNFFLEVSSNYDLLLFCHPIDIKVLPHDPNRVHDLEAIKLVQKRSYHFLEKIKGWKTSTIHELVGTLTLEDRCIEAADITLKKHFNVIQSYKC